MRTTSRSSFLSLLALTACVAAIGSSAKASAIEAVKGKHYKLTKRHGPWMIMCASFLEPPEERRSPGMTPEEAANELVFELRQNGIPAYTYQQEGPSEEETKIKTVTRHAQIEREGRVRWRGGICVLAGNYHASDERVAKDTLIYIKRTFHPEFLEDVAAQGESRDGALGGFIRLAKSGGVFRTTASRPGPLSGAFLTTNPMLSADEIAVRTRDPLVLRLNSGNEYSLLQNRGKFTVVVATFQGKSQTQMGGVADPSKLKISSALDDAMNRAWELCTALRHARSLGYDGDVEAYVYHDRFSSIVTVGSFKTNNDPQILETQNKFGAKIAAINADGSPKIGAEIFVSPKPAKNQPVSAQMKTWIFDPYPQLIEVPK